MPGRSVSTTSLSTINLPSFFSTVTPGQLPTNWLEPVSLLNSVVLPLLGLPARAMRICLQLLHDAPLTTPFGRMDEVKAAKDLILTA